MRARGDSWLLAAACAAGLAGCGGSHAAPHPDGRTVFRQVCSVCHSLSGHEDPRRQGGDLLGFRSSRGQLLQLAREMPVRRRLTAAELNAVVHYVMDVERRRG